MRGVQSAENHAKMVPGYHYVGFPMVALPALYFVVAAARDFSVGALALAVFTVGTAICVFYARGFPLGVQDRVIRLEERLRMERLLPDELKPRIHEIPTGLLIGLRFASDEELPELTRRVLDGELTDRKAVKTAVRNWRADHQRI